MTDRPEKYPYWAMSDIVDDVSKQNNVTEPPEIKKQSGWAYRDKGARNWFNWLGRTTANWIEYLDTNTNKIQNFTVATLPSPSLKGSGSMAYVSDDPDGAVLVFSDGINWRRVSDRKIVS
jgi:hypothetical protein